MKILYWIRVIIKYLELNDVEWYAPYGIIWIMKQSNFQQKIQLQIYFMLFGEAAIHTHDWSWKKMDVKLMIMMVLRRL